MTKQDMFPTAFKTIYETDSVHVSRGQGSGSFYIRINIPEGGRCDKIAAIGISLTQDPTGPVIALSLIPTNHALDTMGGLVGFRDEAKNQLMRGIHDEVERPASPSVFTEPFYYPPTAGAIADITIQPARSFNDEILYNLKKYYVSETIIDVSRQLSLLLANTFNMQDLRLKAEIESVALPLEIALNSTAGSKRVM